MQYLNKTVLLCSIALILGLVLSVPLLISNLNPSPKATSERPFIGLEVPYAYFSLPSYSQNIIGLSGNNNSLVDYVSVVNVTNYSNMTVFIDKITVYGAKYLNVTNTKSEFSLSAKNNFFTTKLNFSPSDEDNLIHALPSLGPHQSKLIALSGTTEIGNVSMLKTGTFYLGGKIDASIGEWHSTWGGSEHVEVQNFGNEYLYNNLIFSNQTLHLQGNYVYIQ
jgi:hypothetical protein